MILGLFVVSASAQTGGILIGTNFGGDPTTINPLLTNNTVDLSLTEFLFPNIYNIDPDNARADERRAQRPGQRLGAGLVALRRWLGLYLHLA